MAHEFLKTKSDIEDWLNRYEIENYTINEDLSVDVAGYVYLSEKRLDFIPVQFGIVAGDFYCSYNNLTTLKGCPVSTESFSVDNNLLTSLEFGPKTVNGYFDCSENQITSLKFSPREIGDFDVDHNQLASLEFCPTFISGGFSCRNNQINTLEFCPQSVGGNFLCTGNELLGDAQYTRDFSKIYEFHIATKIKIEKEKLNNLLDHTGASHKIALPTFKL